MSARRKLLALPDRGDDRGLSLAELVVTMMITSLVLVMAATLTVSSLRQHKFTTAKTTSQADTRLAMEYLTRDLRVAGPNPFTGSSPSAITKVAPRSITFFTSKGKAGATLEDYKVTHYQVTYSVDATSGCLKRTEIAGASNAFPATGAKSRCVTPSAVNTDGEPIFALSGLKPDDDTESTPIPIPAGGLSLPLDEAKLAPVANVQVTLAMRDKSNPTVAPTVVSEWITLMNQTNKMER